MTEGPHGVQMFMLRRETGGLSNASGPLRRHGGLRRAVGSRACWRSTPSSASSRAFAGPCTTCWARISARTDEAQWPMELVFMIEGALALEDATPCCATWPLPKRSTRA